MHDENAVSGVRAAALADVIREDEVGGARLVALGADGEKARRFVHHEDLSVLVEYDEAVRQKTGSGAFGHGYLSVGRFRGLANGPHPLPLSPGTMYPWSARGAFSLLLYPRPPKAELAPIGTDVAPSCSP